MRTSTYSSPLAFLSAFILFLAAASAALAQDSGRKDPLGNPIELSTLNKKTGITKAPSSATGKFEKEGIRVEFSLRATTDARGNSAGLVGGADALATFRVSYATTGQPVTGLHPAAWLSANTSGHAPDEIECKDTIRTFLGGLLSVRPEVDLNGYTMLTLNHDNTITFINPQISSKVTKLEAIVELPGTGADWALSADKNFLYVTMPAQSAVAVVNTTTRKLVGTIPTGEKTAPTRIYLQPDGRYLWVGLDGSPGVAIIDPATNKLSATVEVGAGLHNVAFTGDSRWAYVTNSASDTVSAVNTQTLKRAAEIKVARTPVPVAYSSASRLVYVASINGGVTSVIDPGAQQVIRTIPTGRGVVALRFEPGGRYGLAVNQPEGKLVVFDSSTNAITGTADVIKEPDQVTFTQKYAYVRGAGSEQFSLIDLSTVRKGKFVPMSIQAGRQTPGAPDEEAGVADMIQPTPEGNSVMIANAADQTIYYYVEGMVAPIGTISNYKRRARALMLLDRSLSEVAPGVYSTPVRLTKAGRFDVPMIIDEPRLFNCFQVEIAEAVGGEKALQIASVVVEPLAGSRQIKPNEPAALRFRVTDSATKQPVAGLRDVIVMVFERPGLWQARQVAKEVERGVYEVTQLFPRTAYYTATVGISSRGVRFSRATATDITVKEDAKPGKDAGKGEKGGGI
ncbi:MAG TPA: YncE family protein [Pyrinomonadaceae bacterium]|jgi:YVTN family beta-propeller protein